MHQRQSSWAGRAHHQRFKCSEHTTHQLINEVVHSLSSFDQQDDPPGFLQLAHHVFQRLRSNHFGTFRLVLQEVVHLGHGSIVGADLQRERERGRESVGHHTGEHLYYQEWKRVKTLPRSHGHSCSWWGSGPWQPNQWVRCLLWGGNRRDFNAFKDLVTTSTLETFLHFPHCWHFAQWKRLLQAVHQREEEVLPSKKYL